MWKGERERERQGQGERKRGREWKEKGKETALQHAHARTRPHTSINKSSNIEAKKKPPLPPSPPRPPLRHTSTIPSVYSATLPAYKSQERKILSMRHGASERDDVALLFDNCRGKKRSGPSCSREIK